MKKVPIAYYKCYKYCNKDFLENAKSERLFIREVIFQKSKVIVLEVVVDSCYSLKLYSSY